MMKRVDSPAKGWPKSRSPHEIGGTSSRRPIRQRGVDQGVKPAKSHERDLPGLLILRQTDHSLVATIAQESEQGVVSVVAQIPHGSIAQRHLSPGDMLRADV